MLNQDKKDYTVREARKLWSYKILEDGSITIRKVKYTSEEIVFPRSIGGHLVKEIDMSMSIEQRATVQRVVFPEFLERVVNQSFFRCENIRELCFPENLREISPIAFDNLRSLEKISVASENLYLESRGNCLCEIATKKLLLACRDAVIPEDIKIIGRGAFRCCRNITKLALPEGIESFDVLAFSGLDIESFEFPPKVSVIPKLCFLGCEKITKFVIPKHITKVGPMAFQCCYNLEEVLGLESVSEVGERTFWACHKLTQVSLPDHITIIPEEFFAGCSSLKEIVIPETCKVIGQDAFFQCTQLQEVNIPDSVTFLDFRAFGECSQLSKIDLGHGVEEISNAVFDRCTGLTHIELPSSLRGLGLYVFEECNDNLKIEFADNIMSVKIGYRNKFGPHFSSMRDAILEQEGMREFMDHSDILSVMEEE